MRLIDADALKFDIMCVYGSNPKYLNWLNHAPTVDAVPVIRCKDCVFWEHAFDDWGKCYGIMAGLGTYDGGFCAWAERKEE